MPVTYDEDSGIFLYDWLKELITYYGTGLSHFFVLHFNVHDHFLLNQKRVVTLEDYLYEIFVKKQGYELFLPYSLSSGFRQKSQQDREALRSTFRSLAVNEAGRTEGKTQDVEKVVRDYYSKVEKQVTPDNALPVIEKILRSPRSAEAKDSDPQGQGGKVVLIDFLEKLIPHERSDPEVLEMLQRIALDREIAETNNILICLTSELGMVDPALFSIGGRCHAIRIPMPEKDEKIHYFNLLKDRRDDAALSNLSDEFPDGIGSLCDLTTGFSLYDCDSLNRVVKYKALISGREDQSPEIDLEDVKQLKKEIIKKKSRDLLEEVEAERGFDAIGGLGKIKEYMKGLAEKLQSGNDSSKISLPKGILLAGPPGTGKTILAEALAKEGGLNMVRMGNIRGMYIGESERNLSHALDLIYDLRPVLVFVDEIDQAFGGRGLGATGDSGVGQRIFAKLLEYMGSDRYRGKIVWVAATNRPDILDEAMVRRFDRIIPVLLPNQAARQEIFVNMPNSLKNFSWAEQVNLMDAAQKTKGLTGSDIQIILTRAIEMADEFTPDDKAVIKNGNLAACIENFIHNHNESMYELQTLISMRFCNFKDMLPELDEVSDTVWEVITARLNGDNRPMEQRVSQLQQEVYVGKIS